MSGQRSGAGFSIIEVLVAILVLAFGLLALAHLVGRSSQQQLEAAQRTQSLTLVQDMVDRINDNRKNAAAYVGEYVPDSSLEPCDGLDTRVQRDRCEWRNRLHGADTMDGRRATGAPLAARACITSPAANTYVVAVAWQGIVPTSAPDSPCGLGAYASEPNRRVHSVVLQIAQLGG